MLLVICELEEERLTEMYENGYIDFYIYRTIMNMGASSTSGFWKMYSNTKYTSTPNRVELMFDIEDESNIEELQRKEYLDAMILESFEKNFPLNEKNYPYRALLYNWLEGEKIMDISRESGVPASTLYNMLNRIHKTIRKDIIKTYFEDISKHI